MKSHVAPPVSRNRPACRWSLGTFALAGALALAGCAADAQPGETSAAAPQASSSTSASSPAGAPASALPSMIPATPTSPAQNVPVPELPEAAKDKTPEGAVAFTEFYVELMNYTSTTNDVKPILDFTDSGCRACFAGTISLAEYRERKNLHVVGGDLTVGELWGDVDGVNGTVAGPAQIDAYRSYEGSGQVVEDVLKVQDQLATFTLVFTSGSWKALAIESAPL